MIRTIPLSTLILAAAALLAACSKSEPAPATETPAASAPAAAAPNAEAPPTLLSEAAPANARVWFTDLANGAEVSSPLLVKFGAEGIAIAPAGSAEPASGHHHLVIDAELPAYDQPIPASASYVHFGKGQTETTVELTPGPHTLQLVFANGLHVPFNPPLVSEKITVTVK
jgi:pyruvate/2-oxoglutarate dehydrogenase complex dihydrolipoamide acyltransferase (E2) component